ncbi:acyl-CoA dehydrogenase family protein [Pseudonocardia lutea]|uniref:Acyl-CoA dehydrogenase family protein n=1 Tax=Pseudonocardia lutea TaxID=2172015 RepID=A0ABW1I9S7_9PSEU
MDLTFDEADERFRLEAREWLAAHVPTEPLPSLDTAEGFAAHRAWERELDAAGWSAVHWPTEYGGRGVSLLQWLLFEEEYYAAGAPGRVSQNGLFLLGPTLLEHGTPEQRARYLPGISSAESIWAQAWSEPGAGSDLAAIRSTATRVEGGWRLSGQKTWSSRAAFADQGFGLFRSEPGSTKHRGLTYFLFPLTAEGVSVRPIRQLDGETGFAEIFFDEVFVPDVDVLGGVGQGWSVAMATAASERGMYLRSPGRFMATADRLVDLLDRVGPDAHPAAADAVAKAWIQADAYRLYTFASATTLAEGGDLGVSASVNKVFWSELDIAMHETALELLGPLGPLDAGAPAAVDGGRWLDGYLFSLAGPIYAGTNEIQRNVIAERLLGLPREPRGVTQ